MSLKRILGTMLATRMMGRGGGRGGLGTAAILGGLAAGRRGGLGSKLGSAALGYMAYRAYRDYQAKGTASGTSSTGGGLADMIKDVADRFTGGSSEPDTPPADDVARAEERQAAEDFSEAKALLLIRAMITAAYSDGQLSHDERSRILDAIDQAGADQRDREIMEREIANPKPLDELLAEVQDRETAQQFYVASRAAIDGHSEADRAYLAALRDRLSLTEEEAAEAEELAA